MDTVPLWIHIASAVLGCIASLASIIGYLLPAFKGYDVLKLLKRRFSGQRTLLPSTQSSPQPKSLPRAIINILALGIPLLVLVISSTFLGIKIGHSNKPSTVTTLSFTPTRTPTPTPSPTPSPTPTPASVAITSPKEGSTIPQFTTVTGTAFNIPSDRELWLLVAIQDVGGYYPQGDAKNLKSIKVESDSKWNTDASIGQSNDHGKKVVLYIVLVNKEGRATINQFFAKGLASNNDYKPINHLPGEIMSQINVVRA